MFELVLSFLLFRPVVVLDAPLLFEVGLDRVCKLAVCVWCREDQQLARLTARDNVPEPEGRRIVRAQMPLDAKKAKADLVIDASRKITFTQEQARVLAHQLRGKGLLAWLMW